MESMNENQSKPLEKITFGELSRQFQLAGIFEIIVASTALMVGGIIVVTQLTAYLTGLLVTEKGDPLFAAWAIQGVISLGLGIVDTSVAVNLLEKEVWPFSTSLYVNIILVVIFLTLPFPLGVYLAILAAVSILSLFQPEVRRFWIPSFVEDMKPRLRELRYSLYLIRKSPLVLIGLVVIVVIVSGAIAAPWLAPYGPEERIWADTNLPPMSDSSLPNRPVHFWGTDDSGGDIFSRILWAAQLDLTICITVVFVAIIIGVSLGAIAGYFGGAVDEVIMRVTDIFFAFPGLVLAMAIVMAMGERSMTNISIALMATWWPTYARLVRGQVLAEREKLYVEAARSVGARDTRIILFHIIPNTIQPLIVQATMDTGAVLLTAAGLSFIGFGPPAGVAEWGYMISIGQNYFTSNIWPVFFPGMAILITSLAFNLVGDGIRDILDPKLRRR
ncbi:MAG: ABC transporter permease [Promethearchaeia archaeon]